MSPKIQEILGANKTFEIQRTNGEVLPENFLFNTIRDQEFNIVDMAPNAFEDYPQFPDDIGPISSPRQFHQLGIFVLDGSGSMGEKTRGGFTKGEAINDAMRGVLTRFKASRCVNDFSFAVVTFDNQAKLKVPTTEAIDMDDNGNYNPMLQHGGGTNIMTGLRMAHELAEKHMDAYQQGGPPHSVIILVMTDGLDLYQSETLQEAKKIKEGKYGGQITICTTYFSTIGRTNDLAKNHLKAISTDRVMYFKEVYDAETLRNYFIASIVTSSGTSE